MVRCRPLSSRRTFTFPFPRAEIHSVGNFAKSPQRYARIRQKVRAHLSGAHRRQRLSASNRYELTSSPTLFLILPSGMIEISSAGFDKADLEAIAVEAGRAPANLSQQCRSWRPVPTFKPGGVAGN